LCRPRASCTTTCTTATTSTCPRCDRTAENTIDRLAATSSQNLHAPSPYFSLLTKHKIESQRPPS
jgi:hypothetical protein